MEFVAVSQERDYWSTLKLVLNLGLPPYELRDLTTLLLLYVLFRVLKGNDLSGSYNAGVRDILEKLGYIDEFEV